MRRSTSLALILILVAACSACTVGRAETRPAPESGDTAVAGSTVAEETAGHEADPASAPGPATPTTTRPPSRPAAFTEGRRELVAAGVPDVAAQAYLNASIKVRDISGRCAVPPEILAAIGRIESNHGQVAQLDERGRTTEVLRGYATTGPDTDAGIIDGDATQDWAVGPMQFIPDSWKAYAQDGDGDGVAEPHSFFDAALASAWYLCDKVGGFMDVTVLNGQWIQWDQQVAAAEARHETALARWRQLRERRDVLGLLVLADPTDAALAQQHASAPDPGPEPVYVEPAKPAGPAQFELAMQRYYGPVGEAGDDYIAKTAGVFRTLEQITLGTPVSEADRVDPR
jgi:membrane-bound lytic murein transglycosylase B